MKEMDRIESPMWGTEGTIWGIKDTTWGNEGAMWLQSFFRVRNRVAPVIDRVSQAVSSGSQEDKLAAFSEALEELPPRLEHMKTAPKLIGVNMKKLRKIQKLEEKAMDAYIKYCELGIKLPANPSHHQLSKVHSQLSRAASYWELSKKEADSFLKNSFAHS